MTSYMQKHEWTAFTEEDLLNAGSGNGHSIGVGDTFTMPGSPSVTMSTWDNDGSLSGDNRHNENANDSSGQYARVDGERVGSQMYAESYHVLKGSDGKTYYLIEIEVEHYDAPGTGDDFFTFYGNVPPEGVSLTVKQTCNVKGCWVDYSCLGAGDTAPPNTPPHFTNLPENGIICVDENTTFVIDANASDADGDTLTYEIVGGRDASFFEIDANTGELTFIGAPDYEDPQSGGNNNTYDVTIKVSDGKGGSDTKALWVKVKDVDEGNGECIVIEAEDMHEWGFKTVHGDKASGGELVKLNCAGGTGELSTTFNGSTGEYDLSVFVQDENDGQSVITVLVNGVEVGVLTLDNDNNGGGSDNGNFSKFTLENIQINDGDTVTLAVDGNGHEFVRIDKIELCQDGENCPEGFSLQDFSGPVSGTTVADQFDGFTVVAQRDGDAANSENDAMIFDTANPTGGDNDLGFANQGNAIIISEDNDAGDPDDNAGGGTITFDFDNPSDLHDVKLLDIEGNGTFIELFDESGDLIKRIDVTGSGDNTVQTVLLDAVDVAQMVITLDTSGAVDDLCFKPGEAPLPGSLSGKYFADENKDGLDNDGANGIMGITVELLDQNGNGTGVTTTTDGNGAYSFTGLAAGTYGVKFTDTVTGKTLTTQNVDGDASDDIDSDAADIGGGMSTITGIQVVAGANTPDNDAGVIDPGTASLGDKVFFDTNKNGQQDLGEAGVNGVGVTLFNAAGVAIATTTTMNGGMYQFGGLDAGDYSVGFDISDDFVFTAQDQGPDATDSDANVSTGRTGTYSLGIGEQNLTVDAGILDANKDPEVVDDAGKVCADDLLTLDVLDNDSDPDGDTLTITAVDGQAIAEGETIETGAGTFVTLTGGELVFDGEVAYSALDIGEEATETITYTVGDGNGGSATANAEVTFCGDANSVDSLVASLPTSVTYKVADGLLSNPIDDASYDLQIVTAEGDARLEGVIFEQAYCLDFGLNVNGGVDLGAAPVLTGDLIAATDPAALGVFRAAQEGINGQSATDNFDLVNYILNADFENNATGSVDGEFNAWEVQLAIWDLVNAETIDVDQVFVDLPGLGQLEDVDFIVNQAIALGEGFVAGVGDIVGLVVDPNPSTSANAQPILIGISFEDYDCLC